MDECGNDGILLRIVCHRGVPDSTLSFQFVNGSRFHDAARHLFHDGNIGGLECETSPHLAALQKSEYADIPWTETLPKCYTRSSAKVRVGLHSGMARAMHIPALCGFGVIIFYCRSEAVGQI